MPSEPERPRSMIERPGRLAAIGGAAIICVLSVTGALGLSLTGTQTGPVERQAALVSPGGTTSGAADSGSQAAAGITLPSRKLPPDAASTGAGSTPPTAKTTPDSTALPKGSGEGRRIVFDASAQRVWLVNSDNTVDRTYPVSGSKYPNLNPGTYHVYSKSRYATAYNSDETLNYMVRFAQGSTAPIGFHSIPVYPDGKLAEPRSSLGTPMSDGCVRQWSTDALALWNFAPVGTTVVVLA